MKLFICDGSASMCESYSILAYVGKTKHLGEFERAQFEWHLIENTFLAIKGGPFLV